MATVRNALVNSIIGRYGNALLHLINVTVLARLLTPAEVGIYSVGVAIVSFAQVFRDFGVSTYLIQEKELTQQRVASALGLTSVVAFAMGTIVLLIAGKAGEYYKETGVTEVMQVLAFSFFLLPFGGMAPALLRRKMNFRALTIIGLLCTFTNVAVGIILALQGFGFMCMAWASLASAAVNALLCYLNLPKVYRTFPSFSAWRDVFSISAFGGASALVRQAGDVGTDLIIGRILTFAHLGFYSRANGFLKLFGQYFLAAIIPVAHSKFAKTHRRSGPLREDYGVVVAYVTVVTFSGYAFLGVMSLPIIRALFGSQWDAAAPIASLLCLSGCVHSLVRVNNVLMLSTGRTKAQLKINLFTQPMKLALVFYLTNEFGLIGAAYAVVISTVFQALLTTIVAFSVIGLYTIEITKILGASVLVALISSFVPYYVNANTNWMESLYIPLGIATLAAAASWVATVALLRHPIVDEYRFVTKKIAPVVARFRRRRR